MSENSTVLCQDRSLPPPLPISVLSLALSLFLSTLHAKFDLQQQSVYKTTVSDIV